MDAIDVQCPGCGRALKIPSQYAGQKGSCNHCGAAVQVPAPQGRGASPDAQAGHGAGQDAYGGQDPYGGYGGGGSYDDILGDVGGGSIPPPVVVAQPRIGGGGGGGGGADAVTWIGWGLWAACVLMFVLQALSEASAVRRVAADPADVSQGPLAFAGIGGLCFIALFALVISDAVRQGSPGGSVVALAVGMCCLGIVILPWYLLGRNLPGGPWRLTGARVAALIGLIVLQIALGVLVYAISFKTVFELGAQQGPGGIFETYEVESQDW